MEDNDLYKLKKSKTIRLSSPAVQNIVYMVNETKISESELLRSIIEKAVADFRLSKALDAIRNTSITISEAAKMAGLSYRDFYAKLIDSKILSKQDITEEAVDDFDKHMDDVIKMIDGKTKKK